MLRRANDHETVAFFLVEQTIRRTRAEVGHRGLRSVVVPDGRIERGFFGRLRFRFDGADSDFEPENLMRTRPVSAEEAIVWEGLDRMVTMTRPELDANGNLQSLRLGPRVLRRLPLGSVVALVPDGTPPFTGSFRLSLPDALAERGLGRMSEAELLAAIDDFIRDGYRIGDPDPRLLAPWNPGSGPSRAADRGIAPLTRTHRHARGKAYRCPLCHTSVVKDRFNPRIPVGNLRPGSGSIRDLKGGYMSSLRETYLLEETTSLLEPFESK